MHTGLLHWAMSIVPCREVVLISEVDLHKERPTGAFKLSFVVRLSLSHNVPHRRSYCNMTALEVGHMAGFATKIPQKPDMECSIIYVVHYQLTQWVR